MEMRKAFAQTDENLFLMNIKHIKALILIRAVGCLFTAAEDELVCGKENHDYNECKWHRVRPWNDE